MGTVPYILDNHGPLDPLHAPKGSMDPRLRTFELERTKKSEGCCS